MIESIEDFKYIDDTFYVILCQDTTRINGLSRKDADYEFRVVPLCLCETEEEVSKIINSARSRIILDKETFYRDIQDKGKFSEYTDVIISNRWKYLLVQSGNVSELADLTDTDRQLILDCTKNKHAAYIHNEELLEIFRSRHYFDIIDWYLIK